MSEPYIIDENNFEGDALREAIKSYKEAMRAPQQDLDVEYLIKTLRSVNDACPIKVARNPLGDDRSWNHDAKMYNVKGIEVDDEGRLTVFIRRDNTEFTVDAFLDRFAKLKRKIVDKKGPVMHRVNDEKTVQITDVYSHAFVGDRYAGLPLDLVLGYYEAE